MATDTVSAPGGAAAVNALTVDVEDYFHVEAFAGVIRRDTWDSRPQRVARNLNAVLDLFAAHDVRGTFFTLGWVAERCPELVHRIVNEGHELASHGYGHQRITEMSPDAFREDVRRAKGILEDLGGLAVKGYRAPSFSIVPSTLWAHGILAEEGHRYSSSINPIRHDLYGAPNAPRQPFAPELGSDSGNDFLEIPMTTVEIAGMRLPCGGGGFFRLFPYAWFRTAWRQMNGRGIPCIFYFHPWEIDPHQPRQDGAPLKSRLRHYARLNAMAGKIERALNDFSWSRMDNVFMSRPGDSQAA